LRDERVTDTEKKPFRDVLGNELSENRWNPEPAFAVETERASRRLPIEKHPSFPILLTSQTPILAIPLRTCCPDSDKNRVVILKLEPLR